MYVCNPLPVHTQNERAPGKMSLEPHFIKALELCKISKDYYNTWCCSYSDRNLFYNKYLFYSNTKYFCKTRIFPKKHMCLCV